MPVGGIFPDLKDVTVLMILRGEQSFVPPYEELPLAAGDLVIVAATRQALAELVKGMPGLLHPEPMAAASPGRAEGGETDAGGRRTPWTERGQILAEVMVRPGSEMAGRTLEEIGFADRHHCVVLAVERRSRMLRERITRMPLKDGDVLLIQGRAEEVDHLRGERDVVLMDWSRQPLVTPQHKRVAGAIFLAVVAASAFDLLPIALAAFCGATAMIALRILPIGDATKVLDRKIVLTIAMALALGAAMQETGGAARSEERRVGKGGARTCRSRGAPYHSKKKNQKK